MTTTHPNASPEQASSLTSLVEGLPRTDVVEPGDGEWLVLVDADDDPILAWRDDDAGDTRTGARWFVQDDGDPFTFAELLHILRVVTIRTVTRPAHDTGPAEIAELAERTAAALAPFGNWFTADQIFALAVAAPDALAALLVAATDWADTMAQIQAARADTGQTDKTGATADPNPLAALLDDAQPGGPSQNGWAAAAETTWVGDVG